MKARKAFILFLFFIQNSSFATSEIPLVTIWPQDNQATYQKNSLLNSQDQNQVQVISEEQINRSGSLTLSDIVNGKNGAQSIEQNGRTVISMRGFGDNASSNMLVLLNGQPFLNPDMGTLVASNIPLNEIEQIEILPRSSSVLYGDQAVGGIINIITTPPQKKSYKATLAYGNFATYQAGFDINNITKNGLGYHFSTATYSSNNYREHNAERINNLAINLNYKNTYLSYYKINQHLELPGNLTWQQTQQNPRQAQDNIAFNNQDHDIIQTGLKHRLSNNWFANLDLNFSSMEGIGAYAWNQKPDSFNESRTAATLNYKTSGIINLKKYSILPIAGINLSYGQYQREAKTYSSKAAQNQAAIYGQFIFPITPKISTILGTRYAQAFFRLSDNETKKPINKAFINSLELTWQALDSLNLFIRSAENYRFPKTDEILYTSDNSTLKTQTGVSYEAGSNFKYKNFGSTLTGYSLNLKNEMVFVPRTGSKHNGVNENLDPTRRNGIILDLSLDVTKQLQLNAYYNFVNAKFCGGDFTGKDMPFVAKNNLRLAGIFNPQKNLQFLAELLYTGSRYPLSDIENRSGQLGGFTTYNLGISFKDKYYTLTLRGNNLTNKLYYGYAVATYIDDQTSSSFYPAAGINILATLSIKI